VKIGGICAVVSAAVLILSIILVLTGGIEREFYPVEPFLVSLGDGRTEALAFGWGVLLSSILLFIAILGFYQVLREMETLARIALLASVSGTLLFILNFILGMGLAWELAPRYTEASEAIKPALAVMAGTLIRIQLLTVIIGNVLLPGIGVGLFSLAILRKGSAPLWLGWLGLLVAVLRGCLAPLTLLSDVIELISVIGEILLLVWLIAIGVAMLRMREPIAQTNGGDRGYQR
jgi:hypothetical protein